MGPVGERILILLLGMILDAIFGEPQWLWSRLPHPAVLMGRCIGWVDDTFNHGDNRKTKGIVTLALLIACAGVLGFGLQTLPGIWIDVIVVAVLLAQKSLTAHVSAVSNALRISTSDARRAIGKIVSRDTRQMDDAAISRAAIESAAENLSDGVIAPAFWFLIGGLPGLLIYKLTNTADSMIGYRTPKYQDFGWAAARFDDLLNWVPARLTALLIWGTAPDKSTLNAIRTDAALHRSPNAGWPESAMAQHLNIALAGPRSYDGEMRDFAYVNAQGRHDIGADDIDAAVTTLWKTWAITLIASGLIIAL